MIALRGTARITSRTDSLAERSVWSLVADGEPGPGRPASAYLIQGDVPPPPGYDLYVAKSVVDPEALPQFSLVQLPPQLDYLSAGDILAVSADGWRLHVLWRRLSHQNSVLLTEQCDNYCLMCSQPPRAGDDSWLFDRAEELVRLLPEGTPEILFTGGEPTLHGDRLIKLLRLCGVRMPNAEIHLLSNGRRFSDSQFSERYASLGNPKLMVGIPIYGAEYRLHDYVVQARGAFGETIRGIINLASLDQRVEVRVVLHKLTASVIVEIAEFIARNLPFVDQVALMGLEPIGLARRNMADLWIDPHDYSLELAEAALLLEATGIHTMIYNHQLCLLDPGVWHLAVKSISDWKNTYLPPCEDCDVVELCGGFFRSVNFMASAHVRPIRFTPHPGSRPKHNTGYDVVAASGVSTVPVALRQVRTGSS